MAAASSSASTGPTGPTAPTGQIHLSEFPALRRITLWMVQAIDQALQTRVPYEMDPLHIEPLHFVIKGGAAAEIQLGTSNYSDIDTGLFINPVFKDEKRREIRTNAINVLLETLITNFQNDELNLRRYVSGLERRTPLLTPPFQNRVMYEAAHSPTYAHTPEPAFVGKGGTPLSNNCPFGIWIRENVMAGTTALEMDLISVVVNVNLRRIQHRVVLDIAIPHIHHKNAHSEYKLSEPMRKIVEGMNVPIEKSLALFIEQYAASRSPEINASKTARRTNRSRRLLDRLRPFLTDKTHAIYKNMEEFEKFNNFVKENQGLPSGNKFRNVVRKVRETEPLVFSMFDTANLANNNEEIPVLPMVISRATTAPQAGAQGGGQAQPSTVGGGATRRTRRVQRRK